MLNNLTFICEQSWCNVFVVRGVTCNVILGGCQAVRKGAIEGKECWIQHPLPCRRLCKASNKHNDILAVRAFVACNRAVVVQAHVTSFSCQSGICTNNNEI